MTNMALKKMMIHAYEKIPYYNNLFNRLDVDPETLDTQEKLSQLPVITKKEMLDIGLSNFTSVDIGGFENTPPGYTRDHTSGTTGEPVGIIWKMNDRKKAMFQHWSYRYSRFGITANDRFYSVKRQRKCMDPSLTFTEGQRNVVMNISRVSDEALQIYYDSMFLYKPAWLFLLPCTGYQLAKFMTEKNLPLPECIRYIEYDAEPLIDFYREHIKKCFHVPYTNMYGCEETKGLACECERGNFHLLPGNAVFEIVRDGQPLPYGEQGDVCVTGLHNTAMVYIRYVLGDRGTLYPGDTCPCGNPQPVLKLSSGRISDTILNDWPGDERENIIIYPMERTETHPYLGAETVRFDIKRTAPHIFEATFAYMDGIRTSKEEIASRFMCGIAEMGYYDVQWDIRFKDNENFDFITGVLVMK